MANTATKNDEPAAADGDAAVYELEEIWDPDWFDQADHDRIREVISLLPQAASVVDVGCGNGLFLNTLSAKPDAERPARLCGFDRSAAALKHVKPESHQGDIRALPFKDGEFELATCLEVVEHLPLETYAGALSELARVSSRWVLISVPYAQDLRASLCECPSCATRFNANYHLRSFDERTMRTLLDDYGYREVSTHFIGTSHTFLGYNQAMHWLRPPPPPSYTICPMCGHDDPQGLAADLARKRNNGTRAPVSQGFKWKAMAKKLWPKRQTPTWIATLFEKR